VKLALFDFDGTLTTKDSLGEFIKFAVGTKIYYFKLLFFTPIFILYKIKLMDNSYAKELLFRLFFYGYNEEKFKKIAKEFSLTKLDAIRREDIYAKFLQHIDNNDRVVIVSASMRCWLEPWAQKHKVELLSTELQFSDAHFSGSFQTKNCHGKEKLKRVQQLLDLDNYDEIYVYGDSSGDDAILEIATQPFKV